MKKRSEIRVHRNNCTGLKIFRNWGAALSHRHLVRKTSFNNYRSKYFGISTTIPIHHFRKPSIFNWFMVFGSVWAMPYFNWLRIFNLFKDPIANGSIKNDGLLNEIQTATPFFKKLHLNRVDWVWFDFSRHFFFNVPVEKKIWIYS